MYVALPMLVGPIGQRVVHVPQCVFATLLAEPSPPFAMLDALSPEQPLSRLMGNLQRGPLVLVLKNGGSDAAVGSLYTFAMPCVFLTSAVHRFLDRAKIAAWSLALQIRVDEGEVSKNDDNVNDDDDDDDDANGEVFPTTEDFF
jgi:hypothetical protein